MAFEYFEWPSGLEDGAIEAVFHSPHRHTLTVQCKSENDARSILPELQQFDPACQQHESVVVMSRDQNARALVLYLLEQEMVGQGCLDEMIRDYKDHERENGGRYY